MTGSERRLSRRGVGGRSHDQPLAAARVAAFTEKRTCSWTLVLLDDEHHPLRPEGRPNGGGRFPQLCPALLPPGPSEVETGGARKTCKSYLPLERGGLPAAPLDAAPAAERGGVSAGPGHRQR